MAVLQVGGKVWTAQTHFFSWRRLEPKSVSRAKCHWSLHSTLSKPPYEDAGKADATNSRYSARTKGSPQKGYPWSGRFLQISLRNCCIKWNKNWVNLTFSWIPLLWIPLLVLLEILHSTTSPVVLIKPEPCSPGIGPSGSDLDPPPQPQNSLLRISVCHQVSNGNSYYGEPGRGKRSSQCSFQNFCSLSKESQASLLSAPQRSNAERSDAQRKFFTTLPIPLFYSVIDVMPFPAFQHRP